MTLATARLAPALQRIIDQLEVALDRPAVRVRDQVLSEETWRDLQKRLASQLYDTFHVGAEQADRPPRRLRDPELEQALVRAVPHQRIDVPATLYDAPAPGDGPVLVEREGVRVWAPRELVRDDLATVLAGDRLWLRVPPWRPALSPGFLMVDGSRPIRSADGLLRVYLHLHRTTEAPAVWSAVLRQLERAGAGYRAKVLSAPALYPRRDALVVYLAPDSWQLAPALAAAVTGLPGIAAETSAFTDRLGPGVGAAWEPADARAGMAGLSFGQHRCSVIAKALLDAREDTRPIQALIADALLAANIDPANPARNLDSPHGYPERTTPQASERSADRPQGTGEPR